jgi:hypothetical protein
VKLIFLYGPVASGKLTIARELAAVSGLPVFHNHLVVDAVASVFPFGSERFVKLREQFWLTMLREASEADRSTIFTFAPEPSVVPGFPERVRDAVVSVGGTVCFIRLTVPADEQERRIVNPGRAEFGKLLSVDLLRDLRADFAACEAAMPAATLTIDTSAVQPRAAARMIAEALELPRI